MTNNSLLILDFLLSQFSAPSPIKLDWNFPDDNKADISILEKLRKYEILNPDDIDCTKQTKININLNNVISNYKKLSKNQSNKTKLFIIVRHGEGEHNAARRIYGTQKWRETIGYNMKYHDPTLTEKGIQQSKELSKHFEHVTNHIELVILSPLSRSIQTALHSSFSLLETQSNNGLKTYKCDMVVLEYSRERINPYSCDSRSTLKDIQNIWKDHDFIYRGFEENDDIKWNIRRRESREEMWMRANKMLDYLFERNENIILYFGHGSFSQSIMDVIRSMPAFHMNNTQYIPIILQKIKKINGFI